MMQIYALNSVYQRQVLLQGYLSIIWTENFASLNEFEITTPGTPYFEALLAEGVILVNSETDEPMIVETLENTVDDEGKQILKVSGHDLVSWLQNRITGPTGGTGIKASTLATNVINQTTVQNNGPGTIPELGLINSAADTTTDTYENVVGEVYSTLLPILNSSDVGIRARFKTTSPRFMLELYSGVVRPILFSEKNGTLLKASTLKSTAKLRNVAIIFYKNSDATDAGITNRRVYANGGTAAVQGLGRRDMYVDASSLRHADYSSDATFLAAVDRMGYLALGKQKLVDVVDGEVPDYAPYKYRKDYFLGDIVSFQKGDNPKTPNRVTQYIWSIDSEGYKSYPTFTREE